jgi:hypothetical protein
MFDGFFLHVDPAFARLSVVKHCERVKTHSPRWDHVFVVKFKFYSLTNYARLQQN